MPLIERKTFSLVFRNTYHRIPILYNIQPHAYVVIELKATPFKPEYMGQLNFHINVSDDKVVAQYALSGYDQPIGISDYQFSEAIPDKLRSALLSIEEVEEELNRMVR